MGDGVSLSSIPHPRKPWWKSLFLRRRLNPNSLETMEIGMDVTPWKTKELFREVTLTDNQAGEMIVQYPLQENGDDDVIRLPVYSGKTKLNLSNGQNIEIRFLIKADSLADAISKWTVSCQEAVDEAQNEINRRRIMSGAGRPPNGRILKPS